MTPLRVRSCCHQRRALLLAVALTVFPALGWSQSANLPPSPAQPARLPGDEIVQINPFEVQADSDSGYGAVNSNSLTRFNTELDKLPVSADIYDQRFMTDVAATSIEAMVQGFSAGAGMSAADPGSSAATSQPLDRNSNGQISLRGGLAASTIERNGFMPNTSNANFFTSNFDLERAEVINGPQSLLYGVGGAGGVINLITKQARLGVPAFGSLQFQVGQYGNKLGTLDYGMGSDTVAVRIALTNQLTQGRRVDIGGPLKGAYAQVAVRLWNKTTVRLETEQTISSRNSNDPVNLTALSTANDARNGQSLAYLLASHQIDAAANGGASGAGVIDNGNITWDNVASFGGNTFGEYIKNQYVTGIVDTTWNSWLATEVAAGYVDQLDDKIGNGATTFVAPNVAGNTTGTWAGAQAGATPFQMLYRPAQLKDLRVSALITNDLFGGRAHSQTTVGGDTYRNHNPSITQNYVLSDSSGNPILSGTTTNNGFTFLPPIYWSEAAGPVRNPVFPPRAHTVYYNGSYYTQTATNLPVASLVSPANPLGLTGNGSGAYQVTTTTSRGLYAANFTDWLDGKLSTLFGARLGDLSSSRIQNTTGAISGVQSQDYSGVSFNAGANYALLSWLRPYVEVSDSYNPPQSYQTDPYGAYPSSSKAISEEVGIKISNASKTLSGSLALYHTNSKDEQYSFTNALTQDINPSGLNGRYNTPSTWINVDRKSNGAQAVLTATPTPNWRMRFSASVAAGTLNNGIAYGQLYNDQFHENASGQVTYADGTVVYVNPTFNSKTPTVTSTTAGAVPLTVALMNNSSSAYYANPIAINSQITASTSVAKVLRVVDPVHGAILTGAVGLPISALQIAPNPTAPPPGVLVITQPGDISAGYPRVGLVFTSVYEFHSGFLKGFELGGTARASWKYSEYYYYPASFTTDPNYRQMFYLPTQAHFDGILGYKWKLGRIGFVTQLNVSNMFNHYHVIILPDEVNGWKGPNDATFDEQPRQYMFTTTVRF